MTVLITLTSAGADSGPFDLYSDLDGYISAFETGVSKASLLAGYSSALVPNGTNNIRIKSVGVCVNYIDIVLTTTTTTSTSSTTTTSTSTSTTTTTTTISEGSGLVFVSSIDSFGSVGDVTVNSTSIFVITGDFPVNNGEEFVGSYGLAIPGLSTVGVIISVPTEAPINLALSTGYTDCLITPGYVEFTGVDLSTNPNITITLQPQGSLCS